MEARREMFKLRITELAVLGLALLGAWISIDGGIPGCGLPMILAVSLWGGLAICNKARLIDEEFVNLTKEKTAMFQPGSNSNVLMVLFDTNGQTRDELRRRAAVLDVVANKVRGGDGEGSLRGGEGASWN